MGDERFTTQRTTSMRGSSRSTSPHQAAYATERAKVLFGSYRRGDANDPDAYVAAITAVLSTYDPDLIREVTDPRTGVCTSEKYMSFMPNAGELKVYCDGLAARRQRLQHLGSLPKPERVRLAPPEPQQGDKATVHVPASHERYAKLVEWSKTADMRLWKFGKSSDGRDGMWIAWDVWDNTPVPMRSIGAAAASFTLSAAARKTMADIDAERYGELPADGYGMTDSAEVA
jgi:hypothetical protein